MQQIAAIINTMAPIFAEAAKHVAFGSYGAFLKQLSKTGYAPLSNETQRAALNWFFINAPLHGKRAFIANRNDIIWLTKRVKDPNVAMIVINEGVLYRDYKKMSTTLWELSELDPKVVTLSKNKQIFNGLRTNYVLPFTSMFAAQHVPSEYVIVQSKTGELKPHLVARLYNAKKGRIHIYTVSSAKALEIFDISNITLDNVEDKRNEIEAAVASVLERYHHHDAIKENKKQPRYNKGGEVPMYVTKRVYKSVEKVQVFEDYYELRHPIDTGEFIVSPEASPKGYHKLMTEGHGAEIVTTFGDTALLERVLYGEADDE